MMAQSRRRTPSYKIYKFLHREHVGSLLSGTFLFKHYKLYHEGEWPIADPGEGDYALHINEYEYNPADGASPLGPIFDFSAGVGRVSGIGLHYPSRDFYLSSFSSGDFKKISEHIRRTTDYSSAARMKSSRRLVDLIFRHGSVNGTPVASMFNQIESAKVAYTETCKRSRYDITEIPYAAFLKDAAFREQCEFRIVLRPIEGVQIPEQFLIDCPFAAQSVAEMPF